MASQQPHSPDLNNSPSQPNPDHATLDTAWDTATQLTYQSWGAGKLTTPEEVAERDDAVELIATTTGQSSNFVAHKIAEAVLNEFDSVGAEDDPNYLETPSWATFTAEHHGYDEPAVERRVNTTGVDEPEIDDPRIGE